jgi:hypothetical protein
MSRTTGLMAVLLVGCGSEVDGFDTFMRDGKANYESWAEPADCNPTTYYEDADGDGYGVDGTAVEGETCRPLAGHATVAGDCDDRSSGVSPGAVEICDGRDNDCDGDIDDDDTVESKSQWFTDEDGDGYGTAELVAEACEGPSGTAMLDGDCDDTNDAVHPGRSEVLEDGFDNNCDGLTDFVGILEGTWGAARGDGEAGDRICELSWDLRGIWARDLCPDCAMSFWMEPGDDAEVDAVGCALPSSEGFGIHVMGTEDDGFYLGLSYSLTYTYYGYAYYYYGYVTTYTYYELRPQPDIPVHLDGATLQFEQGPLDELQSDGSYETAWIGFDGTIE